jgi:broad specificity phosphatase PhoE
MIRIFVVRHGETEGNKNRIYRGRWDLPHTENGDRQVKLAGKALGGIELYHIYSSPLMRAKQTAFALASAQQTVELQEVEALTDIDYGTWTRQSDAQVRETVPELHRQWREAPHTIRFPDGEALSDVRARIEPFLAGVVERHPDQNIALASHRVPIKVLLCVALGLDDASFWSLQVDPASISGLACRDGRFSLLFCNETCHLQPFSDGFGAQDF